MRPDSLRKFDFLWLGALVVGIANFVLGYGALKTQVRAQFAASDAGGAALVGGFVFYVVVSLSLWFLVSRLRVEFVKWVLILLLAWVAYGMLTTFADGFALADALTLVTAIMQAAAIWFLFRPDARVWFADRGAPGDPQ